MPANCIHADVKLRTNMRHTVNTALHYEPESEMTHEMLPENKDRQLIVWIGEASLTC